MFTFGEMFGSERGAALSCMFQRPAILNATMTIKQCPAHEQTGGVRIDCESFSSDLLSKNKASIEATDLSLTAGGKCLINNK